MKTLISIFIAIFVQNLFAAGTGITYQGRILNPSGLPITSSAVQFLVQIKSPGSENCLMYEEQQTKNLSSSSGVFSVTINDGSGTRSDGGSYSIEKIFANYGTFSFAAGKCAAGTTYTPASISDNRNLQVYFNDGTFSGWEPMPVQKINFAPLAIEAIQVSGFTKDSLLRVEDPVLGPQTASSLTPANFTDLLALINGTSTKYMTSSTGAGASLPPLTSAPPTPTAGQIWYNSTTNTVQFYDGTTIQNVGISGSGITSINGLTTGTQLFATGTTGTAPSWSSTTNTHTLNIPLAATAGTTAGLISNANWTTFNNKVTTVAGKTGSVVLNIGDIKSTVAGNFLTGLSCTVGQALTYSSVTDSISCTTISGVTPSGAAGGDLSSTYPNPTVATVGGTTAANLASGANLANAATSANTANTIVRRDPSGNLSAGTITGNEFIGTMATGYGQFRAVNGSYGSFIRNDGSDTYIPLLTASGDPYGIWNGLRPIRVNNATGDVYLANGSILFQHSTGNIGIGTATPSVKLDVTSANTAILGTTTGASYGIYGRSLGGGHGVMGYTNTAGYSAGIYGIGTDYGVIGNANIAVMGNTNAGYGVYGLSMSTGTGVYGYSSNAIGVKGSGRTYGVYGEGWAVGAWGVYCAGTNCGGNAAWTNTSDRRLKTEIQPIENALSKILKLDGVTYHWKDAERNNFEGEKIGLIAQDVEKVFPQVVKTDAVSKEALPGGTKSLSYAELVGPIIQAIKEFYNEFDSKTQKLESENAKLKQENIEIKARLERIENSLNSRQ